MRKHSHASTAFFVAGLALGGGGVALLGQEREPAVVSAQYPGQPKHKLETSAGAAYQEMVAKPRPAVTATGSDMDQDPRGHLIDHPPPHVADAGFYGPDLSEDEAEEMRLAALEELVASMKAAGMPEEDIEAMVEAASGMGEPPLAVPEDPTAVAPTVDEVADDLALSMEHAGLPEEEIAAMVDAEYAAEENLAAMEEELYEAPDPEIAQGQ